MALPTTADLKNYLRVDTTAEDAVVIAVLAAATAHVENVLGRPIAAAARTYTVEDRRAASLGLSRLSVDPPAASFLRIPDAPVDTTGPITIVDRTGTTLDSSAYRVDGITGVIRAGSAANPYSFGFSAFPYTVTATTGLEVRDDYGTRVEPALCAAILDIAADLYQRRNPAATEESEGGGVSVRYGRMEETIPMRALDLLVPFRRPPL